MCHIRCALLVLGQDGSRTYLLLQQQRLSMMASSDLMMQERQQLYSYLTRRRYIFFSFLCGKCKAFHSGTNLCLYFYAFLMVGHISVHQFMYGTDYRAGRLAQVTRPVLHCCCGIIHRPKPVRVYEEPHKLVTQCSPTACFGQLLTVCLREFLISVYLIIISFLNSLVFFRF